MPPDVHFEVVVDKAVEESADERTASDEMVPAKSYFDSFVEWFAASPVSTDAFGETSFFSSGASVDKDSINDPNLSDSSSSFAESFDK